MNPFTYFRSENISGALQDLKSNPHAKIIAGGTNLLDLMKEGVTKADRLIDITHLPLFKITSIPEGGMRIGALVRNSDLAYHPEIEKKYPLLAEAILAGASPQLRNMATTGGNLLQRTRCYYFYDTATACNKRQPGSGCSALNGVNRIHAILGGNNQCIAVHPSDMCVALAALQAKVQVTGPRGDREIEFADFHRLPGDTPQIDTNLADDEIITAVDLPTESFSSNFSYIKARERNSYAFALSSAAVGLKLRDGVIAEARFAMGGVAHKPWRLPEAEEVLRGKPATREHFLNAAEVLMAEAEGRGENNFKIELSKRVLVRALETAAKRKGATNE